MTSTQTFPSTIQVFGYEVISKWVKLDGLSTKGRKYTLPANSRIFVPTEIGSSHLTWKGEISVVFLILIFRRRSLIVEGITDEEDGDENKDEDEDDDDEDVDATDRDDEVGDTSPSVAADEDDDDEDVDATNRDDEVEETSPSVAADEDDDDEDVDATDSDDEVGETSPSVASDEDDDDDEDEDADADFRSISTLLFLSELVCTLEGHLFLFLRRCGETTPASGDDDLDGRVGGTEMAACDTGDKVGGCFGKNSQPEKVNLAICRGIRCCFR